MGSPTREWGRPKNPQLSRNGVETIVASLFQEEKWRAYPHSKLGISDSSQLEKRPQCYNFFFSDDGGVLLT